MIHTVRALAKSRAAMLVIAVLAAACAGGGDITPPPPPPPPPPPAPPPPPPPPAPPVVLLAAGDIADCSNTLDDATARIIDAQPADALVATLGDNAYPSGTAAQFANCYHPTWGRFKARTRPSVGNHEYDTPNASGYFGYFGVAAGKPGEGWYSYDYGRWHVVVLNSNWLDGGPPIGAGSAQLAWLTADLAASNRQCTLVYYHHPRFSSGTRGNDTSLAAVWNLMYRAGVDVVLSAHDHLYERIGPTAPNGTADAAFGIRQFTVGTGGLDLANLYAFGPPTATTERRQNAVSGVLRLDLDSASYRWTFLPVDGETWTDTGSDDCHGAPPAGSPHAAPSALTILDPAAHQGRRRPASPLLENRWKRQPETTTVTYLARN